MTICEDAVKLKGDNAALEETTFGLALFSELIDMDAMKDFQQQLEIVLTQIINDDFVQTSDIKACEWCDYKSICKK